MEHLLLEELYIKNFRGYTENKFSFFKDKETKQGIVILGGPNGYGKTSFFDAIEWCLTGTVRRLNDELEARLKGGDTTNASLQKGVLRNILTDGEVRVSLMVSFDGKPIIFTRSFSDKNEKEGLMPEKTIFEISADTTLEQDLESFINEIREYFYDRHTCSYEKNLNMYKKGRKDIYQMFSTFFGSNTKLETIITNLDGNLERGNKKVRGIVEELEDKYKELKSVEKLAKTSYDDKKADRDKLEKEYKQVSGYIDLIKLYPGDSIYDGEVHASEIEDITDKAEQKYKINNQINNLVLISEFPIVSEFRKHQRYYYGSQYLKEFIQDIISPFMDKAKDIEVAQKANIELLRKEQNRIGDSRGLIRRVSTPFQAIRAGNFLLRQKVFSQYHESNSLTGILTSLENDRRAIYELSIIRSNYESQTPIINALRALVDHIEGLDLYRSNNNKCPLCGSAELFPSADIAINAKYALGEGDKERARIEGEYKNKNTQISEMLSKFRSLVNRYCDYRNKEISKTIDIVDKLAKYKKACLKYRINFNELNESILRKREQRIRNILARLDNQRVRPEEELLDMISQSDGTLRYMYDEENSFPYTKEMFLKLEVKQKVTALKELIYKYSTGFNEIKLLVRPSLDLESTIGSRIKILKDMSRRVSGYEALINNKNSLEEALNNLNKAKAESKNLNDKVDVLKSISRELKEYRANKERQQTEQIIDPVNKLYRRITRHTNFKQISLDRTGKTSSKSELRVIHELGENSDCYISNVFSAGQVSTLSIAIFLATAIKHQDSLFRCYFMDDPIQSMDDLNVLSFIDLLRVELQSSNSSKKGFFDQLFISTCDEDFENLVLHKMKSFDVNCCSFHFNRYGNYI